MFIVGPSPLCFSPVNGVFHETTKPFSPKSCLSSTTSMKPSSRSALDLGVSKNRGGDTSQPSSEGTQEHHWSWIRQAHRAELLLLWGKALFGNPIDFWPNTDHWHLYGSLGTVKIPVIRHGTDLSTFTSVWCATRPSDPASATPGVDYVPSSRKVEFGPGVTEQVRIEQSKARWAC